MYAIILYLNQNIFISPDLSHVYSFVLI